MITPDGKNITVLCKGTADEIDRFIARHFNETKFFRRFVEGTSLKTQSIHNVNDKKIVAYVTQHSDAWFVFAENAGVLV